MQTSYKKLYPVHSERNERYLMHANHAPVRIKRSNGECVASYPLATGPHIRLLDVCQTPEGPAQVLCSEFRIERLYFRNLRNGYTEVVEVSHLPQAAFRNEIAGRWDVLSLKLECAHRFAGEDKESPLNIRGQVNRQEGTVVVPTTIHPLTAMGDYMHLLGFDLLCYATGEMAQAA